MSSTFTIVHRSDASAERMFALSLSIDAHLSSMQDSGERAVSGVTNGQIGLGEQVTWRAKHFGVWFTMTSRITHLERPHRFTDEQVAGPFRSFAHEHTFVREGDVTVMTDTVSLASPFLGRFAERIVLVPYLRRLIHQRNRYLCAAQAQDGAES